LQELADGFTHRARSVHGFLTCHALVTWAKTDHISTMMTNYEKYHPYSPVALWVTGVLVFGATLGAGVATIGTVADAAPQFDRLASTEATPSTDTGCDGVIFRDADPECFAVRGSPHPEQARVLPDRSLQDPGEAAGS
jgi:hypothetical protein